MKNVLLAACVVFGLTGAVVAGECASCKPVQATVTQTVEVTKTVVNLPVNAVRGFRSRLAVRRAARQAVRTAATCSTGSCSE